MPFRQTEKFSVSTGQLPSYSLFRDPSLCSLPFSAFKSSMDPLSFTASLLAVIQATRIGIKGIRKLQACRKAPKELDRFRTELEGLEALLEGVETFINQNPSLTYCDTLSTPVALASERIQSVNQILSSPALRYPRLSEENKARLTWIRFKHRLTILAEDIKSIKAELGLRLALVTA